ncbi:MAG TPA: methionyl-tRNA formyltransferase [Pirellulales bacterium]|nr:methionyl-tRNA formyltransferase [Pirellulales bacterium]
MAEQHSSKLRLVMMGTGPFAVPLFRALFDTRHTVAALVTQPVRASRAGRASINLMREVAHEHGTPILDPESVNTDQARDELRGLLPDLFVVADYGQILSAETLSVARLGGVNLHGSLLPKYRGAAPINWALYHGDIETGVTVIHMTPRVDAGPTLAQRRTAIGAEENAVELEQRLAEMGAPLVVQAIDDLAAGRIEPITQDASLASPARRLRKTDGAIDWSRSAQAIKNQVRALEPWPKTYTFWHRAGGEPLRLILGRTSVQSVGDSAPPGTVVRAAGDELVVATGSGQLAIHELQPAGKRMLTTAEFLRGYPVSAGERLGPERRQANEL